MDKKNMKKIIKKPFWFWHIHIDYDIIKEWIRNDVINAKKSNLYQSILNRKKSDKYGE